MTTTQITDYLGSGPASERPVAPNIGSDALAFYLATDTGALYRFDGTTWTATSSVWREGSGAPSDSLGVDGDFYLDGVSGNVYTKAAGAYTVACNIRGPTGATGATGAQGVIGPTGPPGTTTFSGLTGTATFTQLPAEVQQLPIPFSIPGKPASGQVYNVSVPYACTIPANLAGSTVYDTTLATGSAAFALNKIATGNTLTAIGTVTVTSTNHFSATLAGAGGTLAAGDVLQLVAPTQDATLSDLCITILAAKV